MGRGVDPCRVDKDVKHQVLVQKRDVYDLSECESARLGALVHYFVDELAMR